jgi:UDP:flavonoid glycosyltransferase YjiC (YdhE family)
VAAGEARHCRNAGGARPATPPPAAARREDQPFWGWRLTELGAGTTLRFQALTEARLAAAVDEVLKDERRARARSLADEVTRENGAVRAAEIAESWAT